MASRQPQTVIHHPTVASTRALCWGGPCSTASIYAMYKDIPEGAL